MPFMWCGILHQIYKGGVMQIKTVKQLKKLAQEDGGMECKIQLNHGLISRKHISHDGELFYVHNYIDESKQTLTEKEIMDTEHTYIGLAMTKGSLIKEA